MYSQRGTKRYRPTVPRYQTPDIHEILKQEIYSHKDDAGGSSVVNPLANAAAQQVSQPAAPPVTQPATPQQQNQNGMNYGVEDYVIYFDSTSKDSTSSLALGELSFNIPILNNSRNLENIIQMDISSLTLPRLTNDAAFPDYFCFRKAYMQITSIPNNQSVQASGGNFHFEFDINNLNSIAVELKPVNSKYYFSKPLATLDTFRARLMIPVGFKRINLPADRLDIIALAGTNPARFRIIGDVTSCIGPVGVLTGVDNPGVAVYLSGMTSADQNINAAVNNTAGLYATEVINSTDFVIGSLNLSALASNTQCSMVVAKNRIAFTVRFTCIRYTTSTNFLTPVHI